MTADELKKLVSSSDFYDRYNKAKHWDFLPVMAKRAMQSAEFNEIQHIAEEKVKALGNSLYADGTIIEGCAISYDPSTKKANLDGGRVFLDGLIYEFEAATLNVPNIESIQVGIWKKSKSLTEYEDDSLLDPAKSTPQYQMPGGYRIITTAEWGLSNETIDMPFFPIYGISGGEIVTQLRDNIHPEYLETVARYDRHANGHYVVEGLRVTALANSTAGKQTFSVSEGEAHIHGYEALISHSVRLITDELPDLAEVHSEVHKYVSSSGKMVVSVHHTPIEQITQVRVTKARTVTLTHGSYSGCTDELPDTSVFQIIEVKQGALIFEEGTDFHFVSDKLSWSPSGEEPAPYSRYTVTYHYRVNVAPDSSTTGTLTLSGLVEDSLIEIDYTYRMPRKDIIVMYKDRSIGIVRGVPHRYDPILPGTPPEAICLAEVTQTWQGLPTVKNVAIQRVPVDTLNAMKNQIVDLYSLVARIEQRYDAAINAPSSAYNVFVDPLFDDDMRDKGVAQTALIADQTLQLPMTVELSTLSLDKDTVLDYDHEILINQAMHTKTMQVNPYQTFNPLPVKVTLIPSVDRWVEDIVQSIISRTVSFRSSNRAHSWNELAETTATIEAANATLRRIEVKVDASGFGPNEAVKVIFDGIEVACSSARANAQGVFSGTFTIPEGVPTGTKLVRLQGTFTIGEAYFVGVHEVRNTINYYVRYNDLDPLAQTFTLNEARHVSGVDFWLTKKGTSNLRIELRTSSLGYPTQETIASCIMKPSELAVNAWNRAKFDAPVFLTAGVEYAVTIMTDTADYSVGIAELGDWDSSTGWVRSQAYSAGVLFSSSNASTWTAHQTADLAFRLLGAKFRASRKTVSFGKVNLTGVTDIMPLAEVQRTGADTDATFVLMKDNVEVTRMQAWQGISFDQPLSGEYTLSVELFGDSKYSPMLGRTPQILTAKIAATGDYISRSFTCGSGKRVMVSTEEYVPSEASVEVYVETANNVWTRAENSEAEQIGEGWIRYRRFVPCGLPATRLKIILHGSSSARPLVQNISAVILSA